MLQYSNILTSQDKEVRDPVSGHSFPMSLSDVHRISRERSSKRSQSSLLSQIVSLLK